MKFRIYNKIVKNLIK